MKKRPSLSPRQLLLCAAILIFFTALVLFLFGHKRDEKQFTNLTHDLFVSEMSSNTINMHYTLAVPEDFGIYEYEPVLPAYNTSDSQSASQSLQTVLTQLSKINTDKLTQSDAYTYDMLIRKLQNSQKLNEYTLYQTPLSPSSGMQSQLPILLAEYTFRNRRDVEDYLALLDQTDTYFDSLLAFEQEKAASGLSMSTYSLRHVKNQCDTIVTKDALESGTHFLQTTFQERLTPLVDSGEISLEDAEKYISQNNRLLTTVLQPAYEALADGLFLLEDSDGVKPLPTGLSSLPKGKEYYRCLLVSETGSSRSVEEIKELLRETMKTEYNTICTLIQQNPRLSAQLRSNEYTLLPYADADAMLADLQFRMQDDFPNFPDYDTGNSHMTFPKVQVKSVSADLQEYCAPAFYLTTPLDDTDNNVIYVNEKDSPSGLELYTTLAHEGYPGHLYQTVYNNRDFLGKDENKVRQILWYGGYLEGWAIYVEFCGYDYAAQSMRESGREEDALCVEIAKHNRSLILCLYSMMDIMIHYENASMDEIATLLSDFGIHSTNTANAVYFYIADEPCNYMKYYLGYLEIMELKEKAQTVWKDDYSDYKFHKFMLDAGPSDFTALSELLDNTNN